MLIGFLIFLSGIAFMVGMSYLMAYIVQWLEEEKASV